MLISEGLDVTVVQARMRHANATTTLNVYGHMLPARTRPPEPPSAEPWQPGRSLVHRLCAHPASPARMPRSSRCPDQMSK
nr:hypothetical protein [Ornithinimicrobium sediminis]